MKEFLTQVGFSENEAKLYVSLLNLGEGTVNEIARVAKVRRTTAYSVLREMVKKGLIVEVAGKPVRYQVLPPRQALADFLRERIEEAKRWAERLPLIAEEFIVQAEQLYERKPISIDATRELMILRGPQMIRNIMKPIEARVREYIRVLSRPPIVVPRQKDKKPPIGNTNRPRSFKKLVICETDMLKDREYRETIKIFLNSGNLVRHLPSVPIKLVIYDDYASLISMTPNGRPEDHISLLIQNKQIIRFHIKSFELLWEVAKPVRLKDIERLEG